MLIAIRQWQPQVNKKEVLIKNKSAKLKNSLAVSNEEAIMPGMSKMVVV
jgi:hypothetical protein